MSTTTTNLGLIKPQLTDPSDITQTNQNWDIIDEKLHDAYSDENKPKLSNIGAAPIRHDSDSISFGIGTDTRYGHLKLSDATDSTKDINEGVAATPKAVKDTYDFARGKADTKHASADTNYGVGTGTLFGHLQLSDAVDSDKNTQGGVAATPKAVKAAYNLANSKAPAYSYGTEDLTAGSSTLETGKLYLVYE